MKKSIKNYVIAAALVVVAAVACLGFTACDNGPAAESITLSQTSVTLESKATQELKLTVQPEDAKVKIEISDKKVVSYEDGILTALTSGTATVKVYSPKDKSVCAECSVTVNAPEGYNIYKNSAVKFAYPSSWSQTTVAGVDVNFVSGTSSVNMVSEPKNNAYFSASAKAFENALTQQYKALGYTVTFNTCTVEKANYLGVTRVHVVCDYTLAGTRIYQEQMILNSGSSTYILTVTDSSTNSTRFATIFSEFIAL